MCPPIIEGITYSLLDAQRVITDLGQHIKDIRAIGGGARSPFWRKILADVMGMPILVPSSGDASFGTALLAGVGIGLFSDTRKAVQQCVCYEDPILPDPKNHELYRQYFSIYREIHDRLAPLHKTIHKAFVKQ
jgi:xylulokinase